MEISRQGKSDFIGFNYYASIKIGAKREMDGSDEREVQDQQILGIDESVYVDADNPNIAHNEFGWYLDPIGFRITSRQIYDHYRLPPIEMEMVWGF